MDDASWLAVAVGVLAPANISPKRHTAFGVPHPPQSPHSYVPLTRLAERPSSHPRCARSQRIAGESPAEGIRVSSGPGEYRESRVPAASRGLTDLLHRRDRAADPQRQVERSPVRRGRARCRICGARAERESAERARERCCAKESARRPAAVSPRFARRGAPRSEHRASVHRRRRRRSHRSLTEVERIAPATAVTVRLVPTAEFHTRGELTAASSEATRLAAVLLVGHA